MFVFLGLLLVFASVVAILVFGDSPALRNTPLHKLHRWLVWLSSKLVYYATSNPNIYTALRWTVPLLYCVIIFVCVEQFFVHVYGRLEARHSHGHFLYIFFSIGSVVVTSELITFSDPGFATAESVDTALATYQENGLIFFSKTCRTCALPKPARSKHCSVCNRCVYLYDHHCIFVNNCVGQNNYRWFIAFLLANINFMVYGGYLCWTLLKDESHKSGWWHTITRTSQANKIGGILLILAAVFSVVVSAFVGLHFRYMYLGVTTNEADKWGEIEYLVELGLLFHVSDLDIYVERATIRNDTDGSYAVVYISLDDQRVLFSDDESHGHVLQKITSVTTDLTNIYDRGFLENIRGRLLV